MFEYVIYFKGRNEPLTVTLEGEELSSHYTQQAGIRQYKVVGGASGRFIKIDLSQVIALEFTMTGKEVT